MTDLTFHVEPDAWLPVAELLTMFHPQNSQTRNAEEMAAIKRHLQDEGFTAEMIVVNPWNGKIVSGHGRTQAAHELGHTGTLPVVYREYPSEAEHRRAMLRWNLARGHQDEAKEAAEFAALLTEFDRADLAADFGLGDGEFDALLKEFGQGGEQATDPGPQVDRAAELREKWSTELGQMWSLDSGKGHAHRLICGDCTDRAVVERVMGGERAALLFEDPPYGVERDEGFEGFGGFGPPIARRQYADDWDSERPSKETFDLHLGQSVNAIIFGGNFFADILPQSNHWIVWDKLNTMPTFGDCELAWTNLGRKSVKKITFQYNGLIGKEKERFHPTQKPVGLYAEILPEYSKAGDLVFDPFAGSGTTGIACEQLGRKARMIELSPAYCAVILERFSDMTGATPVLLP